MNAYHDRKDGRMKSANLVAGLFIVAFLGSTLVLAEEKAEPKAGEKAESVVVTNAPSAFPTNAPTVQQMNDEFMRKVMETSARIEAVKKEISEREKTLYETHPEIKAMRSQMVEMQKTINRILGEDQELTELNLNRDIVWTVMPSLPKSANRAFPPKMLKSN